MQSRYSPFYLARCFWEMLLRTELTYSAVIPGGQVGAAALETISTSISGTSTTWNVDLAAGTSVTLKLTDSMGIIAYSSPDTIQAGASTTCINSGAQSSASSAGVASGQSGSMTASATTATSGTATAGASATSSLSKAMSS